MGRERIVTAEWLSPAGLQSLISRFRYLCVDGGPGIELGLEQALES
jgi:hypothetical protein